MEQESINPTFGIEIECMYLCSTCGDSGADQKQASPGSVSPTSSNDDSEGEYQLNDEDMQSGPHPRLRGMTAVQNALIIPLKVRCSTCDEEHGWHLPLHPLLRDSVQAGYDLWTVKQDPSVKLSRAEKAQVAGQLNDIEVYSIEIVSRILSFRELTPTALRDGSEHVHEISAIEECRAVYTRLHEEFNVYSATARKDRRLVVSSKCSTHVHIGNGTKGFALSTIRNMLSIIVACGKVLDSLYAARRIGGSILAFTPQDGSAVKPILKHLEPREYNMPWSVHFSQKVYARVKGSVNRDRYPESHFEAIPDLRVAALRYDVPSWLQIIRHAPNLEDLQYLQYWSEHFSIVNLRNLEPYFDFESKRTVEFRQHAGTLQASEILPWVDVCVSLMEFADSHSEDEISKLCAGKWSSPCHNADELLRTLGVSDATQQHYASRVSLSPPQSQGYAALVRDHELAGAAS